MIYTLTLNPAIDYVMETSDVKTGCVNRSSGEKIFFGGKGINVSLVLAELGVSTCALGFIGGFTGTALDEGLRSKGILTDFCVLREGMTRINVKLRGDEVTEINGSGPRVTDRDLASLTEKLERLVEGDTLVIAGSIPPSLPSDTYENIIKRLSPKGVRIVLDTTGENLTRPLKYKPYLIKPNIHELSEIARKELTSFDEVRNFAFKMYDLGAVNVLVSMGADGALLVDEFGEVHFREAFSGKTVNTVGAGDSMLAGFLAGVDKGYDYALRLGTAAGGATAFSDGLATSDAIENLIKMQ